MVRCVVVVITSLTLLSCGRTENEMPVAWNDDSLAADLRLVASQRIYFGHQSVGVNIMDGVRELAGLHPNIPLAVMDPTAALSVNGPFFAESLIGKNSEPDSKCSAYEHMLARV